jgi:hypothetical protein
VSYPRIFRTPGVAEFAEAVDAERARQLAKWGDQRHPDGTGDKAAMFGMPMAAIADMLKGVNSELRPHPDTVWVAADGSQPIGPVRPQWLPIFLEEVFEAAAETDPAKLRAELVQCAAVIAAWISDIDRRGGTGQPEGEVCSCHLVHDPDGHEAHTWTDVDGNWLSCPGSGAR